MTDTESTDGELEKRSIQSELTTGTERIYRAILATFIAALGPLSFGYCLGYSSSALQDLASASPAVRLTDQQGSWFSVSLTCFAVYVFVRVQKFCYFGPGGRSTKKN